MSNSAKIIFHATLHLGTEAQDNIAEQWNSVLLYFRENGVANFPSQYPKMECLNVFGKRLACPQQEEIVSVTKLDSQFIVSPLKRSSVQ